MSISSRMRWLKSRRAFSTAYDRFIGVTNFSKYPHGFPVSISFREYEEKYEKLPARARVVDEKVALAGRIVSIRSSSKKVVFLDIMSDGKTLQVLSELKHFGEDETHSDADEKERHFRALHDSIRRGDIVGVRGFPGKSGKGELSIIPQEIVVLSPCIQPFPNSRYGLKEPELRFRKKYLDLLTNPEIRPIYETRSRVIKFIRNYLENRDFLEVETPMLFSAAGGAAAQPFQTTSRALGKELYLRIAPELFLKQLVIGGFDRVFEIGKVFRNEGIDPTHNPEFTICEFYQAYADYNTLMATAEEMLSGLVYSIAGSYKISVPASPGANNVESVEIDFTPPFKRLPILETLEKSLGEPLPELATPDSMEKLLELCKRKGVECRPPHTTVRLLDKLIGHFIEPLCINPTFLYNHPECMSPLAKSHREQNGVTERFELFVAGNELCNAYTELNDPDVQRERFMAQQRDHDRGDKEAHSKDEDFCVALEYGLPPTGGFGIGIDRLVMLLTGNAHIREVILFPALKPKE